MKHRRLIRVLSLILVSAISVLIFVACGTDPQTGTEGKTGTEAPAPTTENTASADPVTDVQPPYPRTYIESECLEKYDLPGLIVLAANDAFFFEKAEDLSAESIRWYFSYFFDLEHGNESAAWDRWAVREDPEVCVRYFFGENDPTGRSLYSEPTTVYYVPEDAFLSVIQTYLGLDLSGKLDTLYPMSHGRFVYLPEKHALATDAPGGFGGEPGMIRCISESREGDTVTVIAERSSMPDEPEWFTFYEFKIRQGAEKYTLLSFRKIFSTANGG